MYIQIIIYLVVSKGSVQSHVFEAVFTDVKARLFAVLVGVGREIPGVYLIATDLNLVYVLYFCNLLVTKFKLISMYMCFI